METCFEPNCDLCKHPLWRGTTIHHLLLGKRVLREEPSILSMRPLLSLCDHCYTRRCPSDLLATALTDLIDQRSGINEFDIDCYSETAPVLCHSCCDEFPGDTPFYTLEHVHSIGKLVSGSGEYLPLHEIIYIECLTLICPICEARADLLETALDAIELTVVATGEFFSDLDLVAANDPEFHKE